MIKSNMQTREKAVKAALGSVRAEGLTPSPEILQQLSSYAKGEATISAVRKSTIARVSHTTRAQK